MRTHGRHTSGAQSGQAIVLVALMMIGLIGMLGLAIDGGGLYFLHRDTQNAVDASVLAALYTKCTSYPYWNNTDIEREGAEAAASNGFTNGVNGAEVEIEPDYLPPGKARWPSGFSPYVRADITAPKVSYFVQLVYPDPLEVLSFTIGSCEPSMANVLPQGMAIISLRPDGCHGGSGGDNPSFRVTGNAGVFVHNSGIFVNCDDPSRPALNMDGRTTRLEVDGACAVVGDVQDGNPAPGYQNIQCDQGIIQPSPMWSTHPLQDMGVPNAACDTAHPLADPKGRGTVTITPGYYPKITVQNHDHVTFAPGLYCVREFDSTGGSVRGNGVIIYMPANHNGWDASALASVEMYAPSASTCLDYPGDDLRDTCRWKDLLIWADATAAQFSTPSMAEPIHINGGAVSRWTGAIYGPRSQCRIEGQGAGWGLNAQVVCWSVDLNGGSQLDITYDPPAFLQTAPRVSLIQ